MDYLALKNEVALPTYLLLSPQAAADALNLRNIPVFVKIEADRLRSYMFQIGAWGRLRVLMETAATSGAAKITRENSFNFHDWLARQNTIDADVLDVRTMVNAMLDTMVLAAVLTAAQKAVIVNMASSTISRGNQLGIPEAITDQDVLTVRQMLAAERPGGAD